MDLKISDYYITAPLYEPPFFPNREFGFIIDDQMTRHIAFSTPQKLRAFCVEHAPQHVYYSSAKYDFPDIQEKRELMKGWQGSDLVFDIDNDHPRPMTLRMAQKQALKLVAILRNDFALNDIMLTFSGKRGNHVHVRDKCIQTLEGPERREIADYFQEFLPGTERRDKLGMKIKNSAKKNPNFLSIDTQVTADVSRLIRLPGSLHAGSMKPCEIIDLEKATIPIAPKQKIKEKRRIKRDDYYTLRGVTMEDRKQP